MKAEKIIALCSVDTRRRYEARHDLLTALADRWGLRVYNRNLAWFGDADYRAAWKEFPEANDFIHERKFTLWSIAKSIRRIPGDIAECGVFRGASSFLMLSAGEGIGKHLHGFDSFAGLSEPGAADRVGNARTFKWKHNDMAVGEEIAARNLSAFSGQFTLYKGWIPERFDAVAERKFSLVHIDVDLYEPTKAALEFFWPRLTPGGMIVCDDYGFESCPGAMKAMDEGAEGQSGAVIHLTTGQGLLVKPS